MEPNTPLYFYGDNGKYEGITGTSGSSTEYVLPFGWTPIEPPIIPDGQQAIFDIELSAWYLEWIDPYDGLSPEDQATWDAAIAKQEAINNAQDVVDKNLGEAIYKITSLIIKYIPNLTTKERTQIDEFRIKYENWISVQ